MNDQNEPLLTPRERAFLAQNPGVERIPDAPSEQKAPTESAESSSDSPRGIGGWLLLLIVVLILGTIQRAGSASLSIQTAEEANSALLGSTEWQSLTTKIWLIVWIDAIVSSFAAYRLIRHRSPNTIPIVITCLWLLGPVRSLISLLVAGEEGDFTRFILLSSVIPVIWTAYLLKSVRVRNTYSGNPVS